MKIEVEKDVLKAAIRQLDTALQIMNALKNKEVRVCDMEKLARDGARQLFQARYKLNKLAGRDASI